MSRCHFCGQQAETTATVDWKVHINKRVVQRGEWIVCWTCVRHLDKKGEVTNGSTA